jgi:3-hydroxyisobutyrate dehydrogenase-like beta-hydroxyacid dehydrogenase
VTQRIAFLRSGATGGAASARADDFAAFEWLELDARDPQAMRKALRECPIAFTLFDSEAAFSPALQGPHDGLARVIVDLSPIAPSVFARMHGELSRSDVELLGVQAAASARRVYADTALQSRPDVLAVLRLVADDIRFTGACATSKAMATIDNLLFAVSSAASTEALALATRAGLDAEMMRNLLAKGSGATDVLSTGRACTPDEGVAAIARGQELAREYEHALPLSTAAKVFHQWQGVAA